MLLRLKAEISTVNFINRFFICLLIFALIFLMDIYANIRIGIVSDSRYCGERELAWRIKIAGENLGWTVFLDESEGRQLQALKDLDWVICLLPTNAFFNHHCPNYLTILHPMNYLDEERRLLPFYEKYDGYLVTLNDREALANCLSNQEFHSIPFVPSVHWVPYQEVTLNSLVTSIPTWGNRLMDQKFKLLYKLLSRTGVVKFYGTAIINKGYMGKIPFDGVSVINILQQHGIVLVLHSDIHNREGIPTSRIFEAAAASTVIISDKNPFVKQHFGDSVLYIDTSLPVKCIYEQILDCLDTIHRDPKRALEMAKRAHQIFIDNFEMSEQLLKLEALDQMIKSKSRN